MYQDVDELGGASASHSLSPESADSQTCADIYTEVNKPGKGTNQGRHHSRGIAGAAAAIADDDVTIVDSEMYCDAEVTRSACVADDVIIVDNENYGDVESPYEYAQSLIEKKPAPAPKPSPG
jgi:hypothetical protein